jgi:hypothetical protein
MYAAEICNICNIFNRKIFNNSFKNINILKFYVLHNNICNIFCNILALTSTRSKRVSEAPLCTTHRFIHLKYLYKILINSFIINYLLINKY